MEAGCRRERSGGSPQACRCGGICLKKSGVREACCESGDVEVFASRDLELGRHAVDLGTWRCRGMELWRCAASVASKEVWRSGAPEACCG